MITYDTSTRWGFHDRGLLREGLAADIVVFDPDRVAPRMPEVVNDLPAGARRLKQFADGIKATVVNGEIGAEGQRAHRRAARPRAAGAAGGVKAPRYRAAVLGSERHAAVILAH